MAKISIPKIPKAPRVPKAPSKLAKAKTTAKVNRVKNQGKLKIEADNMNQQLKFGKKNLKQTIKAQKAGKKYGINPNLSKLTPEQHAAYLNKKMDVQFKHALAAEGFGSLTTTATGLGTTAIATKDAEYGRTASSKPDGNNQRPQSQGQGGSSGGSILGGNSSDIGLNNTDKIDQILGSIGRKR